SACPRPLRPWGWLYLTLEDYWGPVGGADRAKCPYASVTCCVLVQSAVRVARSASDATSDTALRCRTPPMRRRPLMGKLDGRVVIVTGAARGQGEQEVRLFAA